MAARPTAVLDVTATVAMLIAASVLIWQFTRTPAPHFESNEPSVPSRPIPLDARARIGKSTAPVVMFVFSDFTCEYCRRFARDTFPRIVTNYIDPGTLQVQFKYFPSPQRSEAEPAAIAAECAALQDQFWRFHDLLFSQPVTASSLHEASTVARLDLDDYRICVRERTSEPTVRADTTLAKQLALPGTPTFLVGLKGKDGLAVIRSAFIGARPYESFDRTFKEVIARGL
jgi:protein-disulfide isomerase